MGFQPTDQLQTHRSGGTTTLKSTAKPSVEPVWSDAQNQCNTPENHHLLTYTQFSQLTDKVDAWG